MPWMRHLPAPPFTSWACRYYSDLWFFSLATRSWLGPVNLSVSGLSITQHWGLLQGQRACMLFGCLTHWLSKENLGALEPSWNQTSWQKTHGRAH